MKSVENINYEQLEMYLRYLVDPEPDAYIHPEYDGLDVETAVRNIYEIIGLEDIYQDSPHHLQKLYTHMANTVANVQSICLEHPELFSSNDDPNVVYNTPEFLECFQRLTIAAIFHDIGKPDVLIMNEKKGYHQTPGHERKSQELYQALVDHSLPDSILHKYADVTDLIRLHGASMYSVSPADILPDRSNTFPVELSVLQQADIEAQNLFHQFDDKMTKLVADTKELAAEAPYYLIPFNGYNPAQALIKCAELIDASKELTEYLIESAEVDLDNLEDLDAAEALNDVLLNTDNSEHNTGDGWDTGDDFEK